MAKGWEKRNCYVVHAWYRDELYQESETPMKEEYVVLSYTEAERLKVEYESDPDFEEVYIEEDEREFWVDIEEEVTVSDEQKILEMAAKIKQNEKEYAQLQDKIHKLLLGDKSLISSPLIIGKTPNALAICGADDNMNLTIKKSVIDKCIRPEIRDENGHFVGKTGHGLTEEQLVQSLNNIKKPVMIFEGSREKTLIAVTDLKDYANREIVVAIELNQKEGFQEVNKVTSAYGRNDFSSYFDRQLESRKLLAINTEKADDLLHSIGKKYPKENTFISFDNSIAYTKENVTKVYEKNQEMYENEKNKEDTVQEPDVKSPGVTSETNSANSVSSNKIIGKEKDTVNNQIIKDLKKNNFQPSSGLVNNMKKLHELVGNQLSIADVSNMYSGIKNPEIQDIVKSIAEECAQQEKTKKLPETGK